MAAALPPFHYTDALPASAHLVVIGGGIVGRPPRSTQPGLA